MTAIDVKRIHREIDKCLRKDQHGFRRKLRNLTKTEAGGVELKSTPGLESLTNAIAQSQSRLQSRIQNVPVCEYPDTLPVVTQREVIIQSIKEHPVTIICGETGSGKTTQIPKMCLDAGRGVDALIGHTQPRRIAARSVSSRIASELKTELGDAVGYKVRFNDKLSENTFIKLMTDGVLLAEIQSDPWLNQYDTIIVDEAHERSLNIDFILGYLKSLLKKRKDLKVVITSATIDPDTFSKHFNDAPIITAEGRSYPVEVHYRPWQEEQDMDQPQAIFHACEELAKQGSGDILVFLPGERDIRETADVLGKEVSGSRLLRGVEIMPMLARLSAAEQSRIFKPHSGRRIVLATNVAETSLTVPGIRYVVDSGLARVSRYSARSKLQRLPIEPVSQASANQRKGRCGREAPGICIRLYSEEDFEQRQEFTEPEVLRTNLASVILQMEVSRLGRMESFPFVQSPDARLINDGYQLLIELGAVTNAHKVTPLGKKIARMPIDPRLARMLLAASEEGAVSEVLTIVSALSVQDPRERPMSARQAADELHAEFNDAKSDFLAILNLWEFCRVQMERLSNNQFRKMCRQRFLSSMRIREWRDIRNQLREVLRTLKITENSTEAKYESVHRALLSGLLGNVALKDDKNNYLGTRNRKLMIFPGSGVFGKGPKWIIAAEVSETNRVYARGVAGIAPEWIERAAEPLLKHSYSGAGWHRKRAQVGAYRKSTLYGLVVVEKKRVNYGPINPVESREIFIRSALVEGNYNTNAEFFRHNLKLVDEVVTLEEKTRRRDILVDPEELYRFYDHIVPAGIYSGPQFEKWRVDFEKDSARGLFLSRDFLVRDEEPDISSVEFPDQMEFSGVVLPLKYNFKPGSEIDGVTLCVPVSLLNRVSSTQCEWLVPGLLQEKIIALIKSLPKTLRRNYVPAPDVAARMVHQMSDRGNTGLIDSLVSGLQTVSSEKLDAADFQLSSLPSHLRMRFEVLDEKGGCIDEGRNLEQLQAKYIGRIEENLASTAGNSFERRDLKEWNFGDLPESVDVETQGVTMQGYPALVAHQDRVDLKLLATPEDAAGEMPVGLRALYKKCLQKEIKYLHRNLPGIDVLSLRFAVFGKSEDLKWDIINAAVDVTFIKGFSQPKTREQFYEVLKQQQPELVEATNRICALLERTMEAHRLVAKRISGSVSLSWVEAIADINDQIAHLIYPGFVTATPAGKLDRLPVYFKAIDKRLDSLDREPDRDRRRRAELLPLWERIKQEATSPSPSKLKVRWMFEELRVSVFAQELGTVEKVSVARLEKLLEK